MSKKARTHLSSDPVMLELMGEIGHIRLEAQRVPPFQSLTRSIVYQQLSGKAAGTILNRFIALFPTKPFPKPAEVLKMPLEKLRGAGLSRGKASYILDLAQRCEAGLIPSLEECDALDDETLIARLTEIKGIGRWTVEMFLIFNLGRPDVLPIHDLGVRKGFQIAYGKRALPDPKKLAHFGRKWAPHRTIAARYLWRATERPKKK